MRGRKQDEVDAEAARVAAERPPVGHVVLVGYGRVGKLIATRLTERSVPFVVIEGDGAKAEDAQSAGLSVVRGSALEDRHLTKAGVKKAHHLLIAVPEGFEGGAIFEHAIRLNPNLAVVARAHSDAEVDYLEKLGVPQIVMGERELAAACSACAEPINRETSETARPDPGSPRGRAAPSSPSCDRAWPAAYCHPAAFHYGPGNPNKGR